MELLRLSLLGGLLGLDATAVGQFMLSRPLVAGALAGWASGRPDLGLALGVILELYLLVSFPTGGARFPEGGTATVVAVACAAPHMGAGVLPLAVAVGLVWGQVGGASVDVQRRVNGRLVAGPDDQEPGALVRVHLLAIVMDFLRAFVVTALGIVTGRFVVDTASRGWALEPSASTALLLLGGAVSLGILLNDLGGLRRRGLWFAGGLTLAVVGSGLL